MMDIVALLIALIHVYVFALESLLWGKPKTNKLFRVSETQAAANRDFAFNQGFYNLFLAIAIFAGLGLIHARGDLGGRWLVDYGVLSVFGAGVVLFCTGGGRTRPAIIQAGPAVIYFVLRALV